MKRLYFCLPVLIYFILFILDAANVVTALDFFTSKFRQKKDICSKNGHTVLRDEWRLLGHQNTENCDKGLDGGWYRFVVKGVNANIPTLCFKNRACGTVIPLRIDMGEQELPGVNRSIQVSVCGSFSILGKWDCCVLRHSAWIHNCGGFYIYKLWSPDRCNVGYCVVKGNEAMEHLTAKTGEKSFQISLPTFAKPVLTTSNTISSTTRQKCPPNERSCPDGCYPRSRSCPITNVNREEPVYVFDTQRRRTTHRETHPSTEAREVTTRTEPRIQSFSTTKYIDELEMSTMTQSSHASINLSSVNDITDVPIVKKLSTRAEVSMNASDVTQKLDETNVISSLTETTTPSLLSIKLTSPISYTHKSTGGYSNSYVLKTITTYADNDKFRNTVSYITDAKKTDDELLNSKKIGDVFDVTPESGTNKTSNVTLSFETSTEFSHEQNTKEQTSIILDKQQSTESISSVEERQQQSTEPISGVEEHCRISLAFSIEASYHQKINLTDFDLKLRVVFASILNMYYIHGKGLYIEGYYLWTSRYYRDTSKSYKPENIHIQRHQSTTENTTYIVTVTVDEINNHSVICLPDEVLLVILQNISVARYFQEQIDQFHLVYLNSSVANTTTEEVPVTTERSGRTTSFIMTNFGLCVAVVVLTSFCVFCCLVALLNTCSMKKCGKLKKKSGQYYVKCEKVLIKDVCKGIGYVENPIPDTDITKTEQILAENLISKADRPSKQVGDDPEDCARQLNSDSTWVIPINEFQDPYQRFPEHTKL